MLLDLGRPAAATSSAGRPAARTRWRDLRRALLWHRRLLAAGLAALAVALTIAALEPAAAPSVRVVAAAHDISGGRIVTDADLITVALPKALVPQGALLQAVTAVGRLTAGPVRRGEPLTDVRLVGPALVAGFGDGFVATPVRIQDAGALVMLRPGDHIDVLATSAPSESGVPGATGAAEIATARVVASAVPVITVPADAAGSVYDEGGLVIVATTAAQAQSLAAAAVTDRLSIVVRDQ